MKCVWASAVSTKICKSAKFEIFSKCKIIIDWDVAVLWLSFGKSVEQWKVCVCVCVFIRLCVCVCVGGLRPRHISHQGPPRLVCCRGCLACSLALSPWGYLFFLLPRSLFPPVGIFFVCHRRTRGNPPRRSSLPYSDRRLHPRPKHRIHTNEKVSQKKVIIRQRIACSIKKNLDSFVFSKMEISIIEEAAVIYLFSLISRLTIFNFHLEELWE